jgi:hypothetical protein
MSAAQCSAVVASRKSCSVRFRGKAAAAPFSSGPPTAAWNGRMAAAMRGPTPWRGGRGKREANRQRPHRLALFQQHRVEPGKGSGVGLVDRSPEAKVFILLLQGARGHHLHGLCQLGKVHVAPCWGPCCIPLRLRGRAGKQPPPRG